MTDYAKELATDPNWPAPNRSSVFYVKDQKYRVKALFEDFEIIFVAEYKEFDRQIDMDAKRGFLQEAFGFDEINKDTGAL